jgi:hypothetical protein
MKASSRRAPQLTVKQENVHAGVSNSLGKTTSRVITVGWFTEEYGVNRPDNKPFRGKICQRRQSTISKLIICILTDPRPGKPWCKCC